MRFRLLNSDLHLDSVIPIRDSQMSDLILNNEHLEVADAKRELRKLKTAARDTGALKEANDKLEKQLEELTWFLQLEKRLRIDLEEAKVQEIAKLQNSVENLQKKVDETNALLVKEKEAARKAIEEAPHVIKEIQVIVEDTKKIEY